MYQLYTGELPFREGFSDKDNAQSRNAKLINNILNQQVKFPMSMAFNKSAKLLIAALLEKDYEKRLRVGEQIQAHPYFNGINWSELPNKKPPIKPQLTSKGDVHYFTSKFEM